MKKIILTVSLFAVCGTAVFMSCGKAVSCANLVINVSTAASNFANDPSTANCTSYKSALNNWINNTSCSSVDSATKAEFKSELDSLGC